jgi:hypothetical protein
LGIGRRHPASAPDCAASIAWDLGVYSTNDPNLNGCLVSDLADLKQPSTYPLVEAAFQADQVDEAVMGDWEEFQIEVGLLEQRITQPKHRWLNLPEDQDVFENTDLTCTGSRIHCFIVQGT